jgi:NADH-quinone oxidoreductase subunit K
MFIIIGFLLFIIGVFGIIISRKNLIVMLMSIELVLLALNFLLITAPTDNLIGGQVFVLYILVVAAAESAIGLSLLISYFRLKGTISVQYLHLLKG